MGDVRVRKTQGLGIEAIKKVNGRQGKGLAQRAAAIFHDRVSDAVRSAWANALEQVNFALASGVGNGRGATGIQVEDHEGTHIRVNVGPYQPLTKRYKNKDPKSSKFWRKHSGTPSDGRSTNLANAVSSALRGKGRVRDDSRPVKLDGANWQFRSTFRPEKLPGVLDKIIRHNFVNDTGLVKFNYLRDGEALPSRGGAAKAARSTFRTVQYPESERPLLSKVAHRLGSRMRDSLQKSLSTRSSRKR